MQARHGRDGTNPLDMGCRFPLVVMPMRARRPHTRTEILVRRMMWAGRTCIVLSALFLYLSGPISSARGNDSAVLWATYLMLARLFGICAFAIGGVAIFNNRWTEGVLLCLISVVLPLLSLYLHGTF